MTTIIEERSLVKPNSLKSLDLPKSRRSKLMDLLPAMYAGDDFMNRFLCIFEDTILPLQQMVDNFHYYFHPLTCSPEMVQWLAQWVHLTLDENWSLEERRNLVFNATELYSWRGTRRGLAEFLRLYTGVEPEISEYSDGMTLGPDTKLGINTTIAGRGRFSFTVTMRLSGLSDSDLYFKEAAIRRIIEAEKPAHTTYRLRLIVDGQGIGESAQTYLSNLDTMVIPLPKVKKDGSASDGNGHGGNGHSGVVSNTPTTPKPGVIPFGNGSTGGNGANGSNGSMGGHNTSNGNGASGSGGNGKVEPGQTTNESDAKN